ncbi:hypothetical protein KUTeg_009120 [Tegillarca granosa]|uniref:Protein capicua homolog-like C-terminal tri-helical domain-containing protein n=2 Tax=Tegillarca granosa TaxID=220873 RepID=A0ABQ9F7M6_TEGGR|nr:hypothetical protein KUTeg_009120 [Tegillarca granosa]
MNKLGVRSSNANKTDQLQSVNESDKTRDSSQHHLSVSKETEEETSDDERMVIDEQKNEGIVLMLSVTNTYQKSSRITRTGKTDITGSPEDALRYEKLIPRPSSVGSSFQPKGAVFQAKPKHSRIGSLSDFRLLDSLGQMSDLSPSTVGVQHSLTESIATQDRLPVTQHHTMKMGQMKIHNITMTTQQDKKQIILSSNTQTMLGNGQGPIMGKITQKGPKGIKQQQLSELQPASTPPSIQLSRQVTTSSVQLMAATQAMVTNAYQGSTVVAPTYTTTGKPITTPVPIASKPIVSMQQSGMSMSVLSSGVQQPVTVNSAYANLNVQQQPNTLLQKTQQNTGNMKNVGAILVQNIPSSQYGIGYVGVPSPNLVKSSTSQTVHTNVSGGFITTTLRNIAPPHNTNQNNQNLSTPTQTAAPATLLTNIILKTNQTPPPPQTVQTVQQQPQAVTQAIGLPAGNLQPTHVQYILPSVRVATPNGGKMQNVLQMALPGTPVQQGNIQLTFAGQGNQSHTPIHSPLPQQIQANQANIQPSPQPVATGKFHFAPSGNGIKLAAVTNMPNQGKFIPAQQTANIINTQQNLASPLVLNSAVATNKQQNIPVVTQLVNVNQNPSILASPNQNAKLQTSQPIVSVATPIQQQSHLQGQLQGVYKSQTMTPLSTESKSEIGYVSGTNQSRPHKVKATIAMIPVATESLQKNTTVMMPKPACPTTSPRTLPSPQQNLSPIPLGLYQNVQHDQNVHFSPPSSNQHKPQRPSPLVLSSEPLQSQDTSEIRDERTEETEEKDQETDAKPQRSCKGKKYKEIVAGMSPARRERKSSRGSGSGEEKSPSLPVTDQQESQKEVVPSSTSTPLVTITEPTSAGPITPSPQAHRARAYGFICFMRFGFLFIVLQEVLAFLIQNSLYLQCICYLLFDRVLKEVDFDKQFEELPQFLPEKSEMMSPLPQSPRGILNNYKKKRKVSSLGQATAVFQAEHASIFPTKVCLQLKIREVRQKMMAQSAAVEKAAGAPGPSGSTPSSPAVTLSIPPDSAQNDVPTSMSSEDSNSGTASSAGGTSARTVI